VSRASVAALIPRAGLALSELSADRRLLPAEDDPEYACVLRSLSTNLVNSHAQYISTRLTVDAENSLFRIIQPTSPNYSI